MTLELEECQSVTCDRRPQHRVAIETPGSVETELELYVIHVFLVVDAAPRDGVVEIDP